MTVRLDGKVAIVTGASAGIGKAIAVDLAQRGATVVGTGRRLEPGLLVAKEIEDAGGTFLFVQSDASRWDDCRRTAETALQRGGRIDILVNNAGTALPLCSIDQIEESDWRAVAGPTLDGGIFMSRQVLPTMQAQSDGVILFISSSAGMQALARHGSYCMAKAAVIQLAKVIAVENLANGVRSNALVVGAVQTEQSAAALLDTGRQLHGPDWVPTPPDPDDYRSGLGKTMIDPEDVARAVAVLCSDEAREITGGAVAVDRGLSAGLYSSLFVQFAAAGVIST